MLAAAKALEADKEWHDSVNAVYASRRLIAEEIMSELGCSFDPTQNGLFLWGKLNDESITTEQLADKLLQEAHVFITPGFIFGSNGNRYIRLSLCATEERMKEALHRIKKLTQRNNN